MESRVANEWSRYIGRAEQAFRASTLLLEGRFYEDAISKAYYAMLYASSALLAKYRIRRKKHSAVIAAIGQYFVKPGHLSTQIHRNFINVFEDRETADYNVTWQATERDAGLHLKHAREFIDVVKSLLKKDLKIKQI